MPQSILELIFKTSKSGTGGKAAAQELRDLKSGVGEVSSGLLGFNLASLSAAGAVLAVGAAAGKAITNYQAYAESIRGLNAITGTGTEETSRMVQAFDDLGISQETVASAMSVAAKKGFVATIDNVANLADKYNSLSTQEEKNALLTKELGKGGLELAKALEQGGAAFRAAAAAQSEGMLVTEENAAEVEKLRVAQDELKDSSEALSNTVAKTMVPVLIEFTETLNRSITAAQEAGSNYERMGQGAVVAANYQYQQSQATRDAGKALLEYNSSQDVGIQKVDAFTRALGTEAAVGWNALPPAIQGYITATDLARTANEKLSAQMTDELNTSMQTYNTQLMFSITSEGMSVDQKARLALQMGLIDEKSKYAIERTAEWKQKLAEGKITLDEYVRLVAGLNDEFSKVVSKDVTITTHLVTIDENNPSNSDRRWGGEVDLNSANGGSFTVPAGFPNDSFVAAFTSGETVTVANDRTRATGVNSGGGGPSVVIQAVYLSNGISMAEFEANLLNVMRRI